ncbi:MAG TPA: GMC oxidoreductase [Amycolatopsis sp.]|nr:GMC oxidoreductase [Amycolatopsis sp.]
MPDSPSSAFSEAVDVVIVGSGPNGAAYARVLTETRPRTRVLVVEAGPVVTEIPGLHMANIIDDDERERAQIASQGPNQYAYDLPATSGTAHNADATQRSKALVTRPGLFSVGSGDIDGDGFPAAQESSNVGGMGSHWFGACPRPSEAERIRLIDDETLEDAYAIAEGLLRVSATQFLGSKFAEHVEHVLGDVLNVGRAPGREVQPMPMAVTLTPHGVHRTGPNLIFDDLLTGADENFELRPDTLCEQVLLRDGKVTGVRLRDRVTEREYEVRAEYVVVAGDSLRTPQLLFASGVRPAALGHYLNEHPQVSIMAEVDGLGADSGHDDEVGNSTAMSDSRAVAVAASGVTWIPYEAPRFPFHGMLAQIDPDTVPRSATDRAERKPLISVHFFAAQELRFENWLEFSESEVDWLGMPAMRIHHTLSEQDLHTLEEGKREVLRLSNVLGKPVDGEIPWILPSGSSLHYQGTVRMGAADDGTSVCDPSCRVWGTENLYVAGNGVIPTSTACNPTLTSVALSVIGARDIAARLG